MMLTLLVEMAVIRIV
jgi:hypothetical protein